MKLIIFIAIVMLKCSRLSSAPADLSTEASDTKDEFSSNQPVYGGEHQPNLAYVSDAGELGTTGVVFQFRRSIKSDNTEIEARRRSALDKGFMRFGRAGNMMRFGRSPAEDADAKYEPEIDLPKMRKSDKNMLRFGRAKGDGFMRFGRNFIDDSDPSDYNDASEVDDFIEHPETRSPDNRYDEHGNKILRLGRSSSESVSNEISNEMPSAERTEERNNKKSDKNLLRFGRAGNMLRFGRAGNMLRFGRAGNMMRFGRAGNMMRFGKRGNMMRFGRGHQFEEPTEFIDARQTRGSANDRNLLRLGRAGNLIRFGRNDKNLLRFGKRSDPDTVSSSTKIYCENDDCVVQENENQLLVNDKTKGDHLRELFGSDASKQGYGEYIIDKK